MWHKSRHKCILQRIQASDYGTTFVTADFDDLAETDTIAKILTRLTKKGVLRRVLRGIYWYPAPDTSLEATADPNEVAAALARGNGWHAVPYGDTAQHLSGLSKKAPKEWTYVTDGTYRKYSYKGTVIRFRHTASRMSDSVSTTTATIIQAIKACGRDRISEETKAELAVLLNGQDEQKLLEESGKTSKWVTKLLRELFAWKHSKKSDKLKDA